MQRARRSRFAIAYLLTAVSMMVAPALGLALPAPDEGARSYQAPSNGRLDQQERLAPKYVTAHFPQGTRSGEPVDEGGSTPWRTASVAAFVAAFAFALAAAAGLLWRRRARQHTGKRLASA
jgi:hypothetical protein